MRGEDDKQGETTQHYKHKRTTTHIRSTAQVQQHRGNTHTTRISHRKSINKWPNNINIQQNVQRNDKLEHTTHNTIKQQTHRKSKTNSMYNDHIQRKYTLNTIPTINHKQHTYNTNEILNV